MHLHTHRALQGAHPHLTLWHLGMDLVQHLGLGKTEKFLEGWGVEEITEGKEMNAGAGFGANGFGNLGGRSVTARGQIFPVGENYREIIPHLGVDLNANRGVY